MSENLKSNVILFVLLATSLLFTPCKSQSLNQMDNADTKTESGLTEKYWKLTELSGKKVRYEPQNNREAHIILKSKTLGFTGHGGCNILKGTYQVMPGHRITFSQITSTEMLCGGMETENQFIKVLGRADRYRVQGDTLLLRRAKKTLARFEAVYLR